MPLYVIPCNEVTFGPDWTAPAYGGYGGGIGTGIPPGGGFGGGGWGGGGWPPYWSPPPPPPPPKRVVTWTIPAALRSNLLTPQVIDGFSGVLEQFVSLGWEEDAFVGWPPGYVPATGFPNAGIAAVVSSLVGINFDASGSCGDLEPGPLDLTNLPRGFGETDDRRYDVPQMLRQGRSWLDWAAEITGSLEAGGILSAHWFAQSIAGWYSFGSSYADILSSTPAQVTVSKLNLLIGTRYQFPVVTYPPPPPPPISFNPGRAYRQVYFKNTTAVAFLAGLPQTAIDIINGNPPPPQQIHVCINSAIFGNQGTGFGSTGGWNHFVYGNVAATTRLGLAFAPNGHLYMTYDVYDSPLDVTDSSKAVPVYVVLKDLSDASEDKWTDPELLDEGVSSLFQASGFGAASESRIWKLRAG